MTQFPIVRLEIDHMKHSIMVALGPYFKDLGENADKALDDALRRFDFDAVVDDCIGQIVRESVKDALKKAVWAAFSDPIVKSRIDFASLMAVKKAVDKWELEP